jgi:hypothetical protein
MRSLLPSNWICSKHQVRKKSIDIATCPAYGCVNGRYATIEPDTLVVILDLTHSLPDLVYVRPVAGAENWKDGLAVKRIELSWI